ncbi:hypothetical protein CAOG_009934 [Capsaspora owczarzaki ATCC 30864]|uniref:Uncharacterized protein n=1 Tax=Capsaspora owczarzaki (strain ATCC 30864) TaxID=595528 RepID=A0A0D2VVM5_CAPO3|nr:hypothetical protein CAOG_009934 [Capsaspora owczarzaki ATCC 30864]
MRKRATARSALPDFRHCALQIVFCKVEDENHLLESRVGLDCECVAPELMEAWACLEFLVFAAREGVLLRAIEDEASEVRNSVGRVDGCEVEAGAAPQRPE